MGIPTTTTTNAEKPSLSETAETSKSNSQAQGATQDQTQQPNEKSEAELAAEKVYLERMEDEYAKREGGA
jgi:hypothetical protein